jgi:hypothetical protein
MVTQDFRMIVPALLSDRQVRMQSSESFLGGAGCIDGTSISAMRSFVVPW